MNEDFENLPRIPVNKAPPGFNPGVVSSTPIGAYPFQDNVHPVPPTFAPEVNNEPYNPGRPDMPQQMTHNPMASNVPPVMKQRPPASSNPLAAYFRIPALHIFIPSRGRYSPTDDIDMSITNEVAIFPMTAADELILKNPDSLLNGHALEQVIRSCVPGIRSPRLLPSCDLDVILLAIRSSTYGDEMSVGSKCPNCGTDNEFEISIKGLLGTTQYLEDEYPIELHSGLYAYIKPYTLESNIRANLITFEETKRLQQIDKVEGISEEDKLKELDAAYGRINNLTIELMANSIMYIKMPNSNIVENPSHILEFLRSTDANTVHKIDKKLKDLNKIGIDKNVQVQCNSCKHEWSTEIEIDPTRFFG